MDKTMLLELFGYVGSALVVVSLLMTSVIKLRVLNLAGSIISGTYALIIGSFPLALMNGCLIIINVYNLYKLLNSKQEYELIETKAEDTFTAYFLEHYRTDIDKYFPEFRFDPSETDIAYLMCCHADPAGILLGKRRTETEIEIALEYTTPMFRDCSAGNYLYTELAKRGIKKLYFKNPGEKHKEYLLKMGYRCSGENYEKNL